MTRTAALQLTAWKRAACKTVFQAMLGSDKSRGYCLEMICADFLAGASIDGGNPEILLQSISRFYKFLPGPQQQAFL
jgi:hypothetical protein